MSNILEYNPLNDSPDAERNCNSPSSFQFLPINAYSSDSERSSMERNWLDNRSILTTNLFLNFRKNSIVATFIFILIRLLVVGFLVCWVLGCLFI